MREHLYFKYRDINKYSLDSLVKGSLYFASPEALNDPFDCKLDIQKSLLLAIKKLNSEQNRKLVDLVKDEQFYEKIQKAISRIGVCSFSLDTKNVLMWSHYSNNHKGMTILYRFPEEYLKYSQDHPLEIRQFTIYNLVYKLSVHKPFLDSQSEPFQENLKQLCYTDSALNVLSRWVQ